MHSPLNSEEVYVISCYLCTVYSKEVYVVSCDLRTVHSKELYVVTCDLCTVRSEDVYVVTCRQHRHQQVTTDYPDDYYLARLAMLPLGLIQYYQIIVNLLTKPSVFLLLCQLYFL